MFSLLDKTSSLSMMSQFLTLKNWRTSSKFWKWQTTHFNSPVKMMLIINFTPLKCSKDLSIWITNLSITKWETKLKLSMERPTTMLRMLLLVTPPKILTRKLIKNWLMQELTALRECLTKSLMSMKMFKSSRSCQVMKMNGKSLKNKLTIKLKSIKLKWRSVTDKRDTLSCIAQKPWEMKN